MDMARKFLQMGFTRARRNANHKGGRKYDVNTGNKKLHEKEDPIKAQLAKIFYEFYVKARSDGVYIVAKELHRKKFGQF